MEGQYWQIKYKLLFYRCSYITNQKPTDYYGKKGKFLLLTFSEFDALLHSLIVKRKVRLIQNHHTFLPSYGHFYKTPRSLQAFEENGKPS